MTTSETCRRQYSGSTFIEYPECDDKTSGCRVGARYYRDRDAAIQCSVAAEQNGRALEADGHDFGFVQPGTLRWYEPKQMWEVAVP